MTELESCSSVPQTDGHAYMHADIESLGKKLENEFRYMQSVTTTGIPSSYGIGLLLTQRTAQRQMSNKADSYTFMNTASS